MKQHLTLGSYPGLRHRDALLMGMSASNMQDVSHVQLCPQNHGLVDSGLLDEMKATSPGSLFRFHANTRVYDPVRFANAGTPWEISKPYFETLGRLNRELHGQPYSLHAGERAECSLEQMVENLHRIEDVMQVPVAVEGLYPAADEKYLVDRWSEYQWLLESGLRYALDLSHVNIVAHRSRRIEMSLVAELLASDRCIEIHLSTNDGYSDLHAKYDASYRTWWHALLDKANPGAVAFYEGNEVRKPMSQADVEKRVARSRLREDGLEVV